MLINRKFATSIQKGMEARGWSQHELARQSGVSQATISLIIHGKTSPGLENALALAKALKISLDELIEDDREEDDGQHALAM